jgi:alpha-glucosidase
VGLARLDVVEGRLARAIARLRKHSPTLQTGEQRPYDAGPGILAWTREGDERLLVAVNFTAQKLAFDVAGELVLSSDPDRTEASASLAPSEALILRVTSR